ncbi:MAG: hypothetical protein HYY30_04035 [Chloroflexi bacterium]|nr:hypothetical protein [Chloroflexota bacterium]
MLKRIAELLLCNVPQRAVERCLTYPIFSNSFSSVMSKKRCEGREELWRELFTGFEDQPVCILEFGVWRGESLRTLVHLNTHPDSMFFGFDSFEGLPEDWTSTFQKGHFSTGGVPPNIGDPRVKFVVGWFNRSLPRFIESNCDLVESVESGDRQLFVHFDADLFSSTLYLLTALSIYFAEYHFVFDEFLGDECRALGYAAKACGLDVRFRAYTGKNRNFPSRVAGKISRACAGESH